MKRTVKPNISPHDLKVLCSLQPTILYPNLHDEEDVQLIITNAILVYT